MAQSYERIPTGFHLGTTPSHAVYQRPAKCCGENLYADDTTIYTSDSDLKCFSSRLEEDLNRVAKWIMNNGLKMNIAKTQLMVLSKKGNTRKVDDIVVRSGDQVLSKKEAVKYFSLQIDKDLSWRLHMDSVRQKYLVKLALIRKAGHYQPCSISEVCPEMHSKVTQVCNIAIFFHICMYTLIYELCYPPPYPQLHFHL